MKNNKTMILCTHNGSFHADDIFAYTILSTVFPNNILMRTRDKELWNKADIVFDVGMVYDPENKKYDHHMKNPPQRPDGSLYSSAGLIWKFYGMDYLKIKNFETNFNNEILEKIWEKIDKKIIKVIDAIDVGEMIPRDVSIEKLIDMENPEKAGNTSITEKQGNVDDYYYAFLRVSQIVNNFFQNSVKREFKKMLFIEYFMEQYNKAEDKRVIYCEQFGDATRHINENNLETLFIITKRNDNDYMINCVPPADNMYAQKLPLPVEFAGKKEEELPELSGIKGLKFVHNNRFCAALTNLEDAYKLTTITLEKEFGTGYKL